MTTQPGTPEHPRIVAALSRHITPMRVAIAFFSLGTALLLYDVLDLPVRDQQRASGSAQATMSEHEALLAAARAGDAAAQVKLGHHYMTHYAEGYSNEQVAGDWFRCAAESGDAEGQAWYAVYLWAMADDVFTRVESARPWAQKAAEQGSTLGEYLMGKLTPIEQREECMAWFRRAAEKGFMPAQRDLAFVILWEHYFEDTADPEVREAHEWIARAVPSGDPFALMLAGGNSGRSTMNTIERKWKHPVQQSLVYSRQAIESAARAEWKWYGTLFDFHENFGRVHGKGGAHYWVMTQAAVNLYGLCRFARMAEEARAVPAELVATLKQRAEADPVAANLALAELFQHWKQLYFFHEPCPEDYRLYAARAASAEPTRYDDYRLRQIAAGMLQEAGSR